MASEVDGNEASSRQQDEITLLEAMYPEAISFSKKSQELRYASNGVLLLLRLPHDYPGSAIPEVIVAHDTSKNDLHDAMSRLIREFPSEEEILDAVLSGFQNIIEESGLREAKTMNQGSKSARVSAELARAFPTEAQHRTTVVWLHHLLNTNKRKLVLSPASADVAGITNPGYPGVLLYTGPRAAVDEHVSELKNQNWAAFQVRLEENTAWKLEHGRGVVEMEAMKDVVKDVGENKNAFLKAMRMK